MRALIKLVCINIMVLGFLIFVGNVTSIAAIQAFNWFKPKQYAESHLLPNYDGAAWAEQHFREYYDLTSNYEAYYGWRRRPYEGATINIDADGLRRTYASDRAGPERTIAFFGGSTTWGTGAPDDGTIPSEFVKLNPAYAGHNFGETGYVAHQSLNLFMKLYFEGYRPDVVVFYDGVNDIWTKCRRELDPYAHSREFKIRTVLDESSSENPESFMFTVLPMRNFLEKSVRILSKWSQPQQAHYDCHDDPDKARAVARVLLSDWLLVKSLVESYGGTFVAALQPVAYFSDTRLDHLDLSQALGRQYETLYPLILDMVENEYSQLDDNVTDLRTALDAEEYFYIDWCHLSPNGNARVAARISDVVAARTTTTTASR